MVAVNLPRKQIGENKMNRYKLLLGILNKLRPMDLPNKDKLYDNIIDIENHINNSGKIEPPVKHDFGEPIINQIEFDKWFNDRRFISECDGEPIDRNILQNYFDVVEQFIKSPKSKATKGLFEVATQTIKKYLSQNSR